MRVQICGLLLAMILMPQIGSATDVGYQLATDNWAAADVTQPTKPFTITFINRTWAAPGIEQADRELEPPQKFDVRKLNRFRVEVVEGCGWIDEVGPQWLDEVAWPRTRDMYGLGHSCGIDGFDDRQVFSIGLVTLQR